MSETLTLAPETYIRPQWHKVVHLSGKTCHTMYRDQRLGMQREEWCFRRPTAGGAGFAYYGGGAAFFIDDDPREFRTENDMIRAYTERKKPTKAT